MRRPRRWLNAALLLATIASLLCLASSLLFGVRSFVRSESVLYEHGGADGRSLRGIRSVRGVFTCFSVAVRGRVTTIYGDGWHIESAPPTPGGAPMPGVLGFRIDSADSVGAGSATIHSVQVGVPFWFVALLAGIVPAWRWIAYRRARLNDRPGFEVALSRDAPPPPIV